MPNGTLEFPVRSLNCLRVIHADPRERDTLSTGSVFKRIKWINHEQEECKQRVGNQKIKPAFIMRYVDDMNNTQSIFVMFIRMVLNGYRF